MQPAPQDNQLMSKHRGLSLKPQLRLEWRGQNGQNETEQRDHSASLGDSITSSTRIGFSVHTGGALGVRRRKALASFACLRGMIRGTQIRTLRPGLLSTISVRASWRWATAVTRLRPSPLPGVWRL